VYVSSNSNLVSVIDGTRLIANIDVGGYQSDATFDSDNGYVYVVQPSSGVVNIINGTNIIGSVNVGNYPFSATYDSANACIYVANFDSDNVSVINGTRLVGSTDVGRNPGYAIYDGANGYIYEGNQGASTVSVLDGTTLVGTLSVGNAPFPMIFDPTSADVYVANDANTSISVISTELGLSSINLTPSGRPAGSSDVGSSVTFDALLPQIGTGRDHASWSSAPALGLGCPAAVNFTSPNETDGEGELSLSCVPTVSANFSVWLNVTDSSLATVSSSTNLTVFADPQGNALVVSPLGPNVTMRWAMVGQKVSFTEDVSGGNSRFTPPTWTGLSRSACTGLNTLTVECSYSTPQNLTIQVELNDTDGGRGLSPTLAYFIVGALNAGVVGVNQSFADVGEPLEFQANGSESPGISLNYSWNGLPPGCRLSFTPVVICSLSTAGAYSVTVTVQDPWARTAISPTLDYEVLRDPMVTDPLPNRSSLDAGEQVTLTATTFFGSGGGAFAWYTDLPGCNNMVSITLNCTPDAAGTYLVTVVYTDSNGMSAQSPSFASIEVFSDPLVSAPTFTGNPIVLGTSIRFSTTVTGGFGNISVSWNDLPPGCPKIGIVINCVPSSAGTYRISTVAVDSNGFRAMSAERTLVVTDTGSPGGMVLGLSSGEFYAIAGALLVTVAVVVLVAGHNSRLKRSR
jgi:DNA-binding beta-propeller fold protein YncE